MSALLTMPSILTHSMLVHCPVCLETNTLPAGEYFPAFCYCGAQLEDAEAMSMRGAR
jgi:hypothetical protein